MNISPMSKKDNCKNVFSLRKRDILLFILCATIPRKKVQGLRDMDSGHIVWTPIFWPEEHIAPLQTTVIMSCTVHNNINIRARLIIDSLILKNPNNIFSLDRDILWHLWLILLLWSSKKVRNSSNIFLQRNDPVRAKFVEQKNFCYIFPIVTIRILATTHYLAFYHSIIAVFPCL